ncbi:MAG: hypothetical protein GX548_04485 [Lentisphaerae bacterium]|nr:hypothetical protein [Lentisphaerota bacterium]
MDAQGTREEGGGRAWRWGYLVLVLAVAASWLSLSGLNFWMGELNQDEGWYLYAAGQIREGRLPYRDFAFTQPPLLPLVYSWGYGWIERFGVAGGRAMSWIFGAMGVLSAVWLAMRTGPKSAQRLTGGLCFVLAAVNLYQSYFTTVVKTYALTSLFLAGGLTMLSFVGRRHALRAAAGAGFLLACATATRISMGAALGLGFLYLLACQHRVKAWAWLDFALGGGMGLALMFLYFMAIGGEGFRFGLVEYHTLREGGPWMAQAAFKIGCLSRLVQAYFPAAVAGLFLMLAAVLRRGRGGAAKGEAAPEADAEGGADMPPSINGFLWLVVLVLAGIHLSAPFPYDDYQVPVYPVFCAALSAAGVRWWRGVERRHGGEGAAEWRTVRRLGILVGVWLVCGLHAFSSPMAQNWFVAGRDRIWWRLREQSPLAQLRDMGSWVRSLTLAEGGTELLTQDIYLAVQAGLPVPQGLEMGPFSYYPDWPRERARRIGVMNRDMMRELLAANTNAPIAAFSGYSLAIRSPEVEEISREDRLAFEGILEDRYDRVESVPGFGQAGTTLEIWRLKKTEEAGASGEPAETAGE